MGRTADYSKQSCSIAATLEIIGDPWTLLVIRDAFNGLTRFEQWQERLGVARNVLAARLKTLVQHDILEPRLYSERPPRNEYILTAKGKELSPVLVTLHAWGTKNVYGGASSGVDLIHTTCGHSLEPLIACAHCEAIVKGRDIRLTRKANCPTVGEVMPREPADDDQAA